MTSLTEIAQQYVGESPWVTLVELVLDRNYDPAIAVEAVFLLAAYTDAVQFGGETYSPFPMSFSTISQNSEGSLPTVQVSVSNASRLMGAYVETADGFRSRPVIITIANLDLLSAGPHIQYEGRIRGASLNSDAVVFSVELYNLNKITTPHDIYVPTRCRRGYGTAECGFPLHLVIPGTHPAKYLSCLKTYTACDERGAFESATLGRPRRHPYMHGAFPGTPNTVRQ